RVPPSPIGSPRDSPDEAETHLQLAGGGGAHRADGASAPGVGRERPRVAGHSAASNRRRRLYGTTVYAHRSVRAARAGRSPAPRVLGAAAPPDHADAQGAIRHAPVRP